MRQPRPSAPVKRAATLAAALAVVLAGCSADTPSGSPTSSTGPSQVLSTPSPTSSVLASAAPLPAVLTDAAPYPVTQGLTATRLLDGRVLIAGGLRTCYDGTGCSNDTLTGDTYLFDPAAVR
jgi:hypothetical protein